MIYTFGGFKMDFFKNVGRNILEILEERGMTQVSLAGQIGVSRQVMQKIIKGNKAINVMELSKIAEVLGVAVDRLIQESSCKKEEDSIVMFMGTLSNQNVKTKFDFLITVIDEIVHLEEDLNEK